MNILVLVIGLLNLPGGLDFGNKTKFQVLFNTFSTLKKVELADDNRSSSLYSIKAMSMLDLGTLWENVKRLDFGKPPQ